MTHAKNEVLNLDEEWVELDNPGFYEGCKYRVKPEEPKYFWAIQYSSGQWAISETMQTETFIKIINTGYKIVKLD